MGNNREFSDSIKLEVIKNNLKANNGSICCEICKNKLNSIDECHFDHIYPFAKGGKSTFENCQILCSECNLRKNDKELQDFILEEKAKQFLAGTHLSSAAVENVSEEHNKEVVEEPQKPQSNRLTKEEFDLEIQRFIDKKGDIHKVDFTRAYNKLPSVWYVREYYGDLNSLKKAFGIEDISLNWTREKIKQALLDYVTVHGDVYEKDLKKKNGLPSIPCILRYYPEYSTLTQVKQELLGLNVVHSKWTKEEALEAGITFVKKNKTLTEKDCKAKNGLPNMTVIYRHFGSMNDYQRAIGAPVMTVNEFITKEMVETAVNTHFGNKERIIESRKSFFESFPYKEGVIYSRYGSFDSFCSEMGITCLLVKKAKYTKKDIDDAIHNWVFSGKDIPRVHDLTKKGLPSANSIMKYYENWKEPFILYKKIYDEANRNKN